MYSSKRGFKCFSKSVEEKSENIAQSFGTEQDWSKERCFSYVYDWNFSSKTSKNSDSTFVAFLKFQIPKVESFEYIATCKFELKWANITLEERTLELI